MHGFMRSFLRSYEGGKAMTAPGLKKVLFVCIGNSCRSQMAEAFARVYGSDILVAASAGLAPATIAMVFIPALPAAVRAAAR